MAGPWFVRSGSSGTTNNTGTSWTNAALTLSAVSGLAMAAGDYVWVANDHAESTSGTVTVTFPGTAANPNRLYCVDHTVSNPGPSDVRTGAVVTLTGTSTWQYNGVFYAYGIQFVAQNAINLCHALSNRQFYDTCIFQLTNAGTGTIVPAYTNGSRCDWWNCSVIFSNALQTLNVNATSGLFYWKNSTAFGSGSTIPTNLFGPSAWPSTYVEGVDFSAKTSGNLVGAISSGFMSFVGNRMNAGCTLAATPAATGSKIVFAMVDSTGTNNTMGQIGYEGNEQTETVVVRTNGASDGIAGVSRRLTSTANASFVTPYDALSLDRWNTITASAVNAIVRGIWNNTALPTNGQIWSEGRFFSSSSYPLLSYVDNSKLNDLSTASNVTSDSSAWDSVANQVARSTLYSVGAVIKDSGNAGRIFFCTQGGTTSGSAVSYASATDGTTVNDGTCIFRAGVRFALSLSLTNPNLVASTPVRVFVGAPSLTFYIDPLITAT